jgi:hypothetical protein
METNSSKKNSGETIRVPAAVTNVLGNAASAAAAFDGSNRDEYF